MDRLGPLVLVDGGERQPQVELVEREIRLGLAGEHLLDQVLGLVQITLAEERARLLHRLKMLALHDLDDVPDVVQGVPAIPCRDRADRHPVVDRQGLGELHRLHVLLHGTEAGNVGRDLVQILVRELLLRVRGHLGKRTSDLLVHLFGGMSSEGRARRLFPRRSARGTPNSRH